MNVLLTCAGRRSYLVRFFREALGQRGMVFAADASPFAPALAVADDAFSLPPVNDATYIGRLLDICGSHDVGLLVPLNDLELPVLARNTERFRAIGVVPAVSAPDVVEICSDKWQSAEFLDAKGIRSPVTFLSVVSALEAVGSERLSFPLMVKPRWGSASRAIDVANDDEELRSAHARASKAAQAEVGDGSQRRGEGAVIQERLAGAECGLDVVNDLDGRYVTTFARRKVLMRAGETDQAITVRDDRLEQVGRTLGEALGHIGNLDCDVFVDGDRISVIDMNARFGGGYPFSHAAGANLPAAMIAWAIGEQPEPSWLRPAPQVASSKYDNVVVVNAGGGGVADGGLRDGESRVTTNVSARGASRSQL